MPISTASPCTWQQRNEPLLAAYNAERSIANRNAVVDANLPLVRRTARRESQRSGHCFDDLCQVGSMGLIKAVEAYRIERGSSLSTIAVPWICGSIRHHLRDHCQPLRGSRRLRELSSRAAALQTQQRRQQLPPLTDTELPEALGCSSATWLEAQSLQRALQIASLEQPQVQADGEQLCLHEVLVDPRTSDGYSRARRAERRRLLWRSLRRLERSQRRLLLARVLQGQPWPVLGAMLGCNARAARRQFLELLEQLRQHLGPELGEDLLSP